MGKVRISRNMFIFILGAFIWLVSAMIATATETPQGTITPETTITIQEAEMSKVCTCSCVEMPEGGAEDAEVVEIENNDDSTVVEEDQANQVDNQINQEEEEDVNQVDNQGNQEEEDQVNQVDNQGNQEEEEESIVEESNSEENGYGVSSNVMVVMVEMYPAPLSGEIEYMKFLNDGDSSADLSGWYVMDASEKKYIFKDLVLLTGESFILDYDTSRISLNNGGDTVYLYDAAGNLRQSVEYPAVDKGTKLSFDGDNWNFGVEEEEGVVETQENQDEGQSSQQEVLEDYNTEETEIIEIQNDESVEAIQDVIEIENTEEAEQTENQVNQETNQSNPDPEGESIVYSPAQIIEYQNWLDDSHLTVVGRVISAAGDWIDNRCYLAQENQAIPVLCTQLASEFILGKTQSMQGEVVFKNGGFYRFDPDLLNPSEVEINLSGEALSENLEAYKIYEYQGLVRDFSEKYFKVEIETEVAGNFILRWSKSQTWELPNEGDLIKGLAMADSKGQLWLWESWETMVEPNVLGGTMAAEAAANSEEASAEEEPELPTAYLGLGAAGILGTGKMAWTYRDALKKFVPKKFKA